MKRRKFIKILFVVIVVILLNIALFISFDFIVKKTIKSKLGYLNYDEEQLKRFVAEANKGGVWDKYFGYRNKKLFIKAHFCLSNPIFDLPYKHKYEEYKEFIASTFLLSTDFFQNGMKTDQKVKYIGLYEPYLRPCSNPFSNLFYK